MMILTVILGFFAGIVGGILGHVIIMSFDTDFIGYLQRREKRRKVK